jgi:hypothetical protein
MERLKERLLVAFRALGTLKELASIDAPTAIERDAAIQRFEYSFEAVWKAVMRYLNMVEGWGPLIKSRRSLREPKRSVARRSSPSMALVLDKMDNAAAGRFGLALRGLQAFPSSSLSFLNRPPACLQKNALISEMLVSQRPSGLDQRFPQCRIAQRRDSRLA